MDAVDTGEPVSVPVGLETLGRVFNLLGDPIDGGGPVDAEGARGIHREPPKFAELSPKAEVLVPASRSSTCSPRSPAAARPGCSAGPVSARRSSSPN